MYEKKPENFQCAANLDTATLSAAGNWFFVAVLFDAGFFGTRMSVTRLLGAW